MLQNENSPVVWKIYYWNVKITKNNDFFLTEKQVHPHR